MLVVLYWKVQVLRAWLCLPPFVGYACLSMRSDIGVVLDSMFNGDDTLQDVHDRLEHYSWS
jgi:hypothetical protein